MRQVNRGFSFDKKFFIKFLTVLLVIFSIDTCYIVFRYNSSFGYYVPNTGGSMVSVDIGSTSSFYFNFASALNSIPDDTDATINLSSDLVLSAPITIGSKKRITINGKSKYTITRQKYDNGTWYTSSLFNINAGGQLTLTNLNIDSNNNWILDKDMYEKALQEGIDKIDLSKLIVPEEGGAIATNYLIKNSGNLTIKNTTIQNFFSETKGLFSSLGASSTSLIDTKIIHCATLSGGLVAHTQNTDTKFYIKDNTSIKDNYSSDDGGLFKVDSGSELIIDSVNINDNYSLNSNGYVVMITGSGSSLTMNGGEIFNNSSLASESGTGNGAIYLSLNGQVNMNGGKIYSNQGNETGGISSDDSKTSINLNSGVIENNKSTINDVYKSDILVNDDLNIGEDFTINGNVSLSGSLNNNGSINGNVIINNGDNNTNINGEGLITGDVVNKKENQVLINFNYNGGVDENNKNKTIISVTDKIIFPKVTKEKYDFDGWYLDQDLKIKFNSETTKENITLYAKWILKKYKVVWKIDETNSKTVEYYEGDTIQKVDSPYKEGYDFVRWDNLSDINIMPNHDITINAIWEIKTFNIKFDTNGAQKINDITCEYGKLISKPKNPYLKDKKFIGWYLDQDLKNQYDFNTPVKSSFILYAKWENIIVKPQDKIESIEGEMIEELIFKNSYNYQKNNNNNLKIEIPKELSSFVKISINEVLLTTENYIINDKKIEVKKEFLEKLNIGEYSVNVIFDNGSIVGIIKISEAKEISKSKDNDNKIIIALGFLIITLSGIYFINKKR